ncbi:MAG: protocatechuate 3,4-dioxygenase [Pirellulales bacterium]
MRSSPFPAMPRRAFLGGVSAALFTTPGLFAEQLAMFPTPSMTEGPFYPDQLPLDRDNDLILVSERLTPAVGEVSHLTGRILTAAGSPVRGATIEIWQCDANAVYLHTADSGPKKSQQDQNFQGYGRFTTDSKGQYRFRTIKPVPYPGRPAPHIHFKVSLGDRELLTSQIFIRGHEGNQRDGVFNGGVPDLIDRELVMTDFKRVSGTPPEGLKPAQFAAVFDVVLGRTPSEEQMEDRGPRRRPNS